jgi:translocation and assembly module TamA
MLTVAPPAPAADPQPYSVSFNSSGHSELDNALRDSSDLNALRQSAPAGPFALILRARQDHERLRSVLESFGYYAAHIGITIEGRPVDDSSLAEMLEALPVGKEATVRVSVEPGELYRWREVVVDGDLPEAVRGALALRPGAPALASDALLARTGLLTALQQQGYAFARIEVPVAWVDATQPVIDLHFPVNTGQPVNLGAIDVQGLKRTKPRVVYGRLKLHTGERYDPRRLEATRRDLLTLGVFSGVTVRTADAPGPSGDLPVTFQVAERKRHAIRLTGSYSTDVGGDIGVTWSDRNLFGNAEQLNVRVSAVNLGGSASDAPGYDTSVELVRPSPEHAERAMRYSLAALDQSLDSYDEKSVTPGARYERRFSAWWTGSVGATLKRSHIEQQGDSNLYWLLMLPVVAQYDSTRQSNQLQDPLRGMRMRLSLTPTESLDSPHQTFASVECTLSTYLDLSRGDHVGRSVLALRGLAGEVFGASQFSLPPDQRFYGGGSATVRGYVYQSIGPTFDDGSPTGGTTVAAATIELRQRVGRDFGAAVFVDTGQVTNTRQPFKGTWSVGYGAGLRYYTPVGAIRFDIAWPENPPADAEKFQIYIGIGQAF